MNAHAPNAPSAAAPAEPDPIARLRAFVLDAQEEPRAFADADDLIENGLIDSLRFVDFVLLIAELSGRDIQLDEIDIEAFRSLETIRLAWFAPTAAAEPAAP